MKLHRHVVLLPDTSLGQLFFHVLLLVYRRRHHDNLTFAFRSEQSCVGLGRTKKSIQEWVMQAKG